MQFTVGCTAVLSSASATFAQIARREGKIEPHVRLLAPLGVGCGGGVLRAGCDVEVGKDY